MQIRYETDPSGYMAGALMMVPMRLQYDTAVMAVGIKLISASIAIMLFICCMQRLFLN